MKPLTQRQFAQLGGKEKYRKYGKKAYSEMGRKSGEARRAKKLSTGGTLQTASS